MFYSSVVTNEILNLLENTDLGEGFILKGKSILSIKEGKKHYSVLFLNKLLLRILSNGKEIFLEFRPEYSNIFGSWDRIVDIKNGWIKIMLLETNEICSIKTYLEKILEYEFRSVHGEPIGCCSRYIKCSNARKCIHEDVVFSLSCIYRTNLLNGRIFYGLNKNI